MSAGIKIVFVIYVFILAGIIILADLNGTSYFSFVALVPFGDKIGHFCLMGMFSFIVNLMLKARTVRVWTVNCLLGSLIVSAIVAIEEFSQMFVRGRTFDLTDLLADAAGIFVFGEIARILVRRQT